MPLTTSAKMKKCYVCDKMHFLFMSEIFLSHSVINEMKNFLCGLTVYLLWCLPLFVNCSSLIHYLCLGPSHITNESTQLAIISTTTTISPSLGDIVVVVPLSWLQLTNITYSGTTTLITADQYGVVVPSSQPTTPSPHHHLNHSWPIHFLKLQNLIMSR